MRKLIVIALLLHTGGARADQLLSFSQCLEIVAKNNPEIQAAEETLNSARALVGNGRASYFPQVTAKLGYSDSTGESYTTQGYEGSLNVNQNIFNGFADQAKVQSADAKVISAAADLQAVKAQVSYDLKSAYAGLLYAKESVKLSESILKRRTENLQMVELLFASGRENKGSVLLSKANVKQAELDVQKAKDARIVSESALRKVLGIEGEEALDIQGEVPAILTPSNPDYKNLAEETPDRRKALANIDVAEADLKSAKSGFLPTLNLNGSVGQSGQSLWPDQNFSTVGVTLSWSIFSGGADYFARKGALSLKLAAENKLKNTNLDLIAILKQSYAELSQSGKQLEVSDTFVQAASVRAEITRKKYNNGLSSFDDWEIVENDLITRQKSYTENKKSRILSEASWEKVQGKGSIP